MYRKLRKLGSDAIRNIMSTMNLDIDSKYMTNVAYLTRFLEDAGYDGVIQEKCIVHWAKACNKFIIPAGEPKPADYIMAQNLCKQDSKERMAVVNKFYTKVDDFINNISNTPLPEERWNVRENKFLEKVGSRTFIIDFDNYDDSNRERIVRKMLDKFWTPFLKKITIEQKWIIKYYTENGCYTASIRADDIDKFKQYLENQNWDTLVEEEAPSESDSVIKVRFSKIRRIELIDYTEYPSIEKPKLKRSLKKNETKIVGRIGKKYGKRNGRFWKWTLDLPTDVLNLERYQIFNTLDKETVKSMAKEHCLVYALQQFGIASNITEDIKTHLNHCHFPMSKLAEIANISNITFKVRYYKSIDDSPKYMVFNSIKKSIATVNLILYEHHYMLDEDIKVNINYIKLRKQMQENPLNTRNWELKDALRVERFRGDRYTKLPSKSTPTCSLPQLLKTLFAYGYFKPITCNDYLIYYSSLYKESLEESPIIAINEKDTRRLKDFQQVQIKKDIEKNKDFLSILLTDDYDTTEIYEDIKKRCKEDPDNKHLLKMIDDEIVEDIIERKPKPSCIIYADFECSTDGKAHHEYCICADKTDLENTLIDHFEKFAPTCATDFLDWCDNNSLIYFHNLSYDMNFLLKHFNKVKGNPIIFNGRDMSYNVIYNKKTFTIRDSYAMISSKLEAFPSMFKLDSGVKEAFPYDYYTAERVIEGIGNIQDAVQFVKPQLKQQFIQNIETLDCYAKNDETSEASANEVSRLFDMKKYALFYCNQDVKILRQGMSKFRKDMIEALDLDCIESLSISSVADKYFKREIYFKNGNLYEVSGVLQKNLSKCVHGGRCMTRDNEKQIN